MQNNETESHITVQTEISWSEFINLCGFSELEIHEFVEFGVLKPLYQELPYIFSPTTLHITQRANRLRRDFELPPLALDLVFDLLTKIDRLEQELGKSYRIK